ncbi:MAG: methylenetetrahydrofolate reductase [NAD(P)H] [Bacteroidota bacterium]
MKVSDQILNAETPPISYEIIPPKRGTNIESVFGIVEQLKPHEPPFIDVTSHAAEIYYEEMPDGTVRKHVKRKRPGTLGLCAAIQHRFGIPAVPHLLCQGFTREETEDALIELHYLGIRNVLALRGDDKGFRKPTNNNRSRNDYAEDLVRQIDNMNRGQFLEQLIDAQATDFCVGVAGYPEKHFESPNPTWDVLALKRKVDAGADYIVTQMFFDNRHYFDFVERCREVGITVPIVPGLKIITSKKHLTSLPAFFHLEIPEALAAEVEAADRKNVSAVGIEWARQQAQELLEGGAPALHFYIMQTAKHALQVVEPLRKMA